MKLVILGSGICIFKKDRKGPAFLIDTGDQQILFDCGWGFGENFLRAGYDLLNLDRIVISHPHADHMGGLMNILQSLFVDVLYFPEKKRTKPLYLHGYKGFIKDYETLRTIMFPEKMEPYEIKLFEYPNNTNTFEDITLTGMEVQHNPKYFNSSAYRLEHNGKVFMYSGDTSMDETIATLSKDADIALYEASNTTKSYNETGAKPNHLSPFEAGLLAQKAQVKKLGLVHIYYDLTTKEEIQTEVTKNFTGELFFPSDLQVVEI